MTAPPIEYVQLAPDFGCYGVSTANAMDELRGIFREAFTGDTYFRDGIVLPGDATVLDVGANVGLFALALKRRHPATRIHAFEPSPPTLEALHRNLALHGADDVVVHPFAIGRVEQDAVPFSFFRNLPGNSTLRPDQKAFDKAQVAADWGADLGDHLYAADQFAVPMKRLSTVLRERPEIGPIDLLKIDVEGAELDVLAGLGDENWSRVRQIVMEVQDLDGALDVAGRVLDRRGFSWSVEAPPDLARFRYKLIYAVRAR